MHILLLLSLASASMRKTVISTPNAPGAIGPYNQAILATYSGMGDGTLYISGQIGMNPKTPGKLVPGGITNETN